MIDLYPCFEHLKQFNNIFVYSDPHFSDPEMVYLRKNYIGDEEQVNRINSIVGRKDVIIFLGDIGNVEWIKKVRGYKILIMGNHDSGKSNYQRRVIDGIDNHLFDEVYTGVVMLNEKILLSHEPINLPFVFNIHGHDHACVEVSDNLRHLNVCAEHIDYMPVSLIRLTKMGVFGDIESIHRMTIDRATKRKEEKMEKLK